MKLLQVILAIWLIASPWILGFSGTPRPTWSAVISGVVLIVLLFATGGEPVATKSSKIEEPKDN